MAEYFEADEFTREYDPRIVRRILAYLRPHRRLALLCALALFVATGSELVVPVVVRSIVDGVLLVSWEKEEPGVPPGTEGAGAGMSATLPAVVPGKARIDVAGMRFLRRSGGTAAGYDTAFYIVSRAGANPGRDRVLDRLAADPPPGFVMDSGNAAIPLPTLAALSPEEASALRRGDLPRLDRATILLFAALLAVLAGNFTMTWASSLVGQNIMKDMRMQLFAHTAGRSLDFLSRQPVGRLVTRLTGDVETINQFFTDVLVAFVKDASVMAGAIVVLFVMDARLAAVVAACLPAVFLASDVARRRARDAFRNQRMWTSRVNAYLSERISGINVVRLFSAERRSAEEFANRDRELMRANLGEMYVFATFRPVVDFLAATTTAVVLYAGARLVGFGSLSLGTLIAFVNLVSMFYAPVKDLSEKYTLLQSAMAGGERIFGLLDRTDAIPDVPTRTMPESIHGHLEFRDVWFAYKAGEWVLRDMNFAVRPGTMLALVGYTGAGKSTIANLVTRFWDADRGTILLDGIPVRDLPLRGLRRAVQAVPQDVFMFSGSIRENIALGLDLSDDELRAAARAVAADTFIEALPEGYETKLTEGGTNLSQGQRQLVSFARVVAHRPSLVILDEATSSVDTETERLVQRGIEGLLSGRTSVVIAHRLSTIMHADRILVLSQGRIVEDGGHEELLARGGLYWNLYRLQNGMQEP